MTVTQLRTALAVRLALGMLTASLPLASGALGLGKLTVESTLGQPLRARIDVSSASPDELKTLSVVPATLSDLARVGIGQSEDAQNIRFSIEQQNGKTYIRLLSQVPMREPFINVLADVRWDTGHIFREVSILLDPPVDVRVTAPTDVETTPEQSPVAANVAVVSKPVELNTRQEYIVKKGDTLRRVAEQSRMGSVSVSQILATLKKLNPNVKPEGALLENSVLSIPNKQDVQALAKQVARHWDQHRDTLRAVADKTSLSSVSGSARGRIVDSKPVAPQKTERDQVQVAKAKVASPEQAQGKKSPEDIAAAQKSQQAQGRITELEQRVHQLEHVLELKNKELASMQQRSSPSAAAPLPTLLPGQVAKNDPKSGMPAMPSPLSSGVSSGASPASTGATASNVVSGATAPALKSPDDHASTDAASAAESNSINAQKMMGGDGIAVGAAGLVLLGSILSLVWLRRKKKTVSTGDFGAALGGKVSGVAPEGVILTEFNTTQVGSVDTDDVDPIAEADVYIAYGRDHQAEEILRDAIDKQDTRPAIRVKLMEIYAQRRDIQLFSKEANLLRDMVDESSAEWENVCVLGSKLDPGNVLYMGHSSKGKGATADTHKGPQTQSHLMDLGFTIEDDGATKKTSEATFNIDLGLGAAKEASGDVMSVKGQKAEEEALLFVANSEIEKPIVASSQHQGSAAGGLTKTVGAGSNVFENATRLDLAKAYRDVGETDRARQLLHEVVAEGDDKQKQLAQSMLNELK